MEEYERCYNGDAVRKCAVCEWCKDVEDSMGRTICLCMNMDSGAYLEETRLMGWYTVPVEDEEPDFYRLERRTLYHEIHHYESAGGAGV